jgi:glycosyltransferase involved in cell wall biosynthesis
LLIVGPDEDNIHKSLVSDIYSDRIIVKGYTSEPEKFMCISDFLCLPSHREGFGMVILEAAACGIPSIGSDIYGIQDAIVHNKTGLLFEKSNPEYLSKSIKILTNNKQLRLKMGQNANKRVLENFSKEFVVKEYLKHIHYIIQQSM